MYPDAPRCPTCNGYARVFAHDAPEVQMPDYPGCWYEAFGSRGYCWREKLYWQTPAAEEETNDRLKASRPTQPAGSGKVP